MIHPKHIQETVNWLSQFVIEHTICPFAKREFDANAIYYSIAASGDMTECLTALIFECQRLDAQSEITTTLLIIPEGFDDFENFLDLLHFAETLLVEQGYEGIYQIASFHPDYCFQDAPPDDPANFTNRSPYPMLHLLRESSIESALENIADPDSIPERNIAYTRELGTAVLQRILRDCF